MTKKMIYIASPFFTPTQLIAVEMVENIIRKYNMAFYSPRLDGVLQNMTPEQRVANAPKTFKRNCVQIANASCILAILDEKDSGTTFELGFAYACRRYTLVNNRFRIFGYRNNPAPTMNIMLRQCLDAFVESPDQLDLLLKAYAAGQPIAQPAPSANVI